MTRDPRVDPQPGDVLDEPQWRLTVTRRTELDVYFKMEHIATGAIYSNNAGTSLYCWRLDAADASIVHVAPTPEPSR